MTDTATDDGSGIAVEFPDLTTTGFTGTGARDTSSTYDSNTYTITTSNLAAPAAKTVVVYDSFGNSTTETVTFVRDVTAPTGGSVSVPAYSGTLGSIAITRTDYTDAASGIATNVITRSSAQAPTSPGVCPVGGYTGTTTVTSPDTVPTDGRCYVYTLTGTDNVGNNASVSSSPILVDTTAPTTPTIAFSGLSTGNTYNNGTGTLYFRPSTGGTFTVTAASTDAQSAIKTGNPGYTFGSLNTNGGANFNTTQTADHIAVTFDATTTGPTTQRTANSTNNTNTNSTTATYTITQDSTNPTNGSVSVPAYSGTLGSITITRTDYTDAASGIATNVITRSNAQAPTSPGVCPVGGYTGTHHRHQPRHRPHRQPVLPVHPHRHRQRRQQRLGQLQPDPRRHHRPHHTGLHAQRERRGHVRRQHRARPLLQAGRHKHLHLHRQLDRQRVRRRQLHLADSQRLDRRRRHRHRAHLHPERGKRKLVTQHHRNQQRRRHWQRRQLLDHRRLHQPHQRQRVRPGLLGHARLDRDHQDRLHRRRQRDRHQRDHPQ